MPFQRQKKRLKPAILAVEQDKMEDGYYDYGSIHHEKHEGGNTHDAEMDKEKENNYHREETAEGKAAKSGIAGKGDKSANKANSKKDKAKNYKRATPFRESEP